MVNCKEKGTSCLLRKDVATRLLESAKFYEEIDKWYLWLMVVMPDHIHFIATFDLSQGVKRIMGAWKSYQATMLGVDWQSDFFEHRLRNDSEFDEKAFYIRMNPVRKGLVISPDEWPYVIDRATINDGSAGTPRPTQGMDIGGRAKPPAEPLNNSRLGTESSPYPSEGKASNA